MWAKPASPSTSETRGGSPPQSPAAQHARRDSAAVRNPGRRFAQIVRLKPQHIDEYEKAHAAVWPEVLQQIKACNIQDYSISHDKDSGILFASFKYVGYDFVGDMEKMRENPKVREWWQMTDGWQESLVPGAKSSESGSPPWWKEIKEVFYMP
ncbi:DUF718 domain protein [Microdochium trichocladiopsis]|uniref:DUF718 domain protein n=1 Tax=Microdochium trichocladiopsis TaxID=1682393 RepID=A0A9P8YEW6_9PEZI|nr:DUF718 domain protein [Microdochium trichocladiopsis]KAH7037642.1 DUF718 domain protein [Microdochium trichocladiopsis]